MRIIVVGGTGTIGTAVALALSGRHEVFRVSRTTGDVQVDITSKDAIQRMFDRVGPFDALVCAAGSAAMGPLPQLTDEQFQLGLQSKLMGQVNLVRLGLTTIRDGGSFTLTSGILAEHPSPGTSAIALVNGGLNAFVRAAALDMPRGIRINAVSPPWVTETLKALGMDPSAGLPADKVARAYVASIEGSDSGKVLDARTFA